MVAYTGGLTAQVGWFGLSVGSRLYWRCSVHSHEPAELSQWLRHKHCRVYYLLLLLLNASPSAAADDRPWAIADTDSALRALERRYILRSLWNTAVANPVTV